MIHNVILHMKHAGKQMKLENMTLSEIALTQRDKLQVFSLTCKP